MTFLLLTLLAIALTVTAAGFLLSNKAQTDNSKIAYYGERRGYRGNRGYRGYRNYSADLPLRARRWTVETEQIRGLSFSWPVILGRIFGGRADEPLPWKAIVVGLVSIFILGLYALTLLLPHSAAWSLITFASGSSASTSSGNAPAPQYHVSQDLVRIGQLDPGQYNSTAEYNTWAMSTCSAASMTEVMNAYGRDYRITDILKVEAGLHEITPEQGLLEDIGVQRTAAKFGFNTTWGHNLSLDQIINIANSGKPVIVSFPPYKYPGGHLLVVRGGNAKVVFTADSSTFNHTSFSRQNFLQLWGGFSAILTPAS